MSLTFVVQLVGGAEWTGVLGTEASNVLVLLFIGVHRFGYAVGLVFFGPNCLALAYLIFRSTYVPRVLGILMLLAGAGYLIDSFAQAR